MAKFSSILFLLLVSTYIKAQCPDSILNFKNQNQVDSFLINYPDCEHVNFDVFISNSTGDIHDLSAFDNLKSIEGDLQITGNPGLNDLNYFNFLDKIEGDLIISQNINLNSIQGFKNLKTVNSISINNNSILDRFELFQNIDSIRLSISIFTLLDTFELVLNNSCYTQILSLNGNVDFNLINTIDGLILADISSNRLISSFKDLSDLLPNDLTRIRITNLDSFEMFGINNLSFLENITLKDIHDLSLNQDLALNSPPEITIWNCQGFSNLNGIRNSNLRGLSLVSLDKLFEVNEFRDLSDLKFLSISDCSKLTNLRGFDAKMNLEQVFINSNEILSDCAIEPICYEVKENPENVFIKENYGKCETIDSVLLECATSSVIDIELFDLSIFPNPVHDVLTLNYSTNAKVVDLKVLDNFGRVVQVLNNMKTHHNISNLQSGSYYLYAITKNTKSLIYFIKL
ncbi:MAG: T9SS type A sorting domain-containing protein [Bacteroidia bacterium]|nr:T9SS type A sorting domain-containing protein [Bacteroidia bacterium]